MSDLERMEQLLNEASTQTERLRMMAEDGDLTPQAVMGELHETVMSLIGDFAATAFSSLAEIHQYLHDEVEPVLLENTGSADPDDPSQLMPQDADELAMLLGAYKASMVAGLDVHMQSEMSDEDKKAFEKEVRPQIERISKAIERVDEMRLYLTDDAGDDAGDEDGDEDAEQSEEPATE